MFLNPMILKSIGMKALEDFIRLNSEENEQ